MKKAVIIFCLLVSGLSFGQAFEKGGNYITLGYGLDPWGHPGIGNAFGTYKKSYIGPIMMTYEYGVTDILGIGRIGAGGGVAQSFYTQRYKYGNVEDVYRRSRTAVLVRAAYHFDFGIDKLDVYAGVGGAVYFYTDTDKYFDPYDSKADGSGYVLRKNSSVGGGHYVFGGVRYYFTSAFGVYAEAGHGLNAFSGGMVFHF